MQRVAPQLGPLETRLIAWAQMLDVRRATSDEIAAGLRLDKIQCRKLLDRMNKRGRVVHMLASYPDGVTQHDTLPWHTRLGGTIHALRKDGLEISTELEGEYRHARYRLITPGTVTVRGGLRPAA